MLIKKKKKKQIKLKLKQAEEYSAEYDIIFRVYIVNTYSCLNWFHIKYL